MNKAVVVINAGSSSIKFSIHASGAAEPVRVLRGQIEGLGTTPHFIARDAEGNVLADTRPGDLGHTEAFNYLGEWLTGHLEDLELAAVGHRVVHGGPDLREPLLVDEATLDKLETYVEVPSDQVPFERRPWMKAGEVTDEVVKAIASGEFQYIRVGVVYTAIPVAGLITLLFVLEKAVVRREVLVSKLDQEIEVAASQARGHERD